jgi:rhamnosyltransferase
MLAKVAVLLAAYNGERWIEEQITTILKQNNVFLDLYISLDLSTDNTLNIITKLTEQYYNIKLLPYGQRFGSAAPNFYYLLLNAPIDNYDYIALSDQDDIWLENKIESAINLLGSENGFGYSSDVIAFWEDGKKKLIKKSYPQCKYDYLFEAPGPGCTFVLKKELALNLRKHFTQKNYLLIDLKYHDWLIYAVARSNGFKWIIDNNVLIKYRQHSNNQLGVNNGITAFCFRIKKILAGEGIDQVIKTITFLNIENDDFVERWYKRGKINYVKLACYSNDIRRSIRDKIIFFIVCIILYFKGKK